MHVTNTTESGAVQPKPRAPRAAITVIVAVIAVGALIATATWVFVELSRQQPTLSDLLSERSDISAVDDTKVLCAEIDCIEGWQTKVGVFLRFRTNDMAEYWQYVIGADSVRYENSLLDMSGLTLTRGERRLAIDTLFSRRDWRVI